MHRVTKIIEFCYGHRLIQYDGPCRFLHGHNGRVELDMSADRLDHRGMVIDFNRIKRIVKTWIDETLDHRMLLHRDDPLLPVFQQQGEPVRIMAENPTAEHIARVIFDYAKEAGLPIVEVRFWETPSSYAAYRE